MAHVGRRGEALCQVGTMIDARRPGPVVTLHARGDRGGRHVVTLVFSGGLGLLWSAELVLFIQAAPISTTKYSFPIYSNIQTLKFKKVTLLMSKIHQSF
jgi:hypothetical protein